MLSIEEITHYMTTNIDPANLEVINNTEKSRFEILLNGKYAVAEYVNREHMIVFTHTEVPTGFEGMGIGSKLATAGLTWAREQKKTVLPLCPYFAAFVRRHKEYQDLILPGFKF